MRELTLKIVAENGDAIQESKITVEENEMLIMQVKEGTTYEQAHRIHDLVGHALKEKVNVVTLPEIVSFKVLKIEE